MQARTVRFRLSPHPPFRLDLTVWTLRRRGANVMDRWDGTEYRRLLPLDGAPVEVAVVQHGPPQTAELNITATGSLSAPSCKRSLAPILRRMLGLDLNLDEFYRFAARDARLAALTERFRGMRPPRFPTVFEALVNGIACQQMSLTLGIMLLNRLSQSHGLPSAAERHAAAHAFPRPEDLAVLDPRALRPLGFSQQKSRAIVETSRAICERQLDLESLADVSDAEAVARLTQLRGVGRWTAEYVLLRGLGRWHLFPADDVGARNNLTRWLKLKSPLDYDRVHAVLARWRRYAGLIYFHLLLDRLDEAGLLRPSA